MLVQLEQLNYIATSWPEYRHLFMNIIMKAQTLEFPFSTTSYRLYLHSETTPTEFRSLSARYIYLDVPGERSLAE